MRAPFRILGPFEVGGAALELPRLAQVLLGVLLLRANEVVSTQRIADEIWGERPPASWPNAVQVYVSRIRKALVDAGVPGSVRRQPPGYVFDVPVDALDWLVFERLYQSARAVAETEPERAAELLREALALWRGPALDGLTFESFAATEVERLGETRLEALERRIGLDLALGRHRELVAELEGLVGEHPFRESLRGKLVLALYRAGRQADALAECRRARRFLIDELGIEPGAELRELERSVLQQDPAIALPLPAERAVAGRPTQLRGRRTVTAVCAVTDEAELADRDPELLELLASRWEAAARDALERREATVVEIAGGELLAFFGLPAAHEDDPLRGCRAALAVQAAAAPVLEELAGAAAVGLRVGVEVGEVIVGEAAAVSGPVVSRVRRLAASAPAGQVALGPQVWNLVAEGVQVRDQRGQRHLVAVDRDAEAIPRDLSRPLVGRDAELDVLRRAFDRCLGSGRAALTLVSGAAGIGKSRIVGELVSVVGGRATVLHGRCLPDEAGVAFAPLVEIVGQLLARRGRRGLVRLVAAEDDPDEIVARFLALAGAEEVASTQEETYRAVRKLLEGLASVRPLVLVVDDLHWAEPALLDLLETVASAQGAIAIVCTARPDLLEQRPAWAAERRDWSSVSVGPLAESACAELLAGIPGSQSLSKAARGRIVLASGGNPLFVEQLAAVAAVDWADQVGEPPIPASLRGLLLARLDKLQTGERAILEIASILADSFTLDELEAHLPEDDRASVAAMVELLVENEFLRRTGAVPAGGGCSFVHPLIRTTVYDTIPKRRRADLHASYADLVDATETGGSADETVGHHLERAFRCRAEIALDDDGLADLADRARQRLALAGRRRYAQGDLTTAVSLLTRAATCAVDAADVPGELLLDVGDVLREVGRLDEAEQQLQRGIDASSTRGDERLEWRIRAALVRVLLQIHGHQLKDVRELADQTLVRLTELEDAEGLARAWRVEGWLQWLGCRAGETESALAQAIDWARRAGNERLEADSANLYLGAGLFGPLPVEQAVERCVEMRRRQHDRRRIVSSCARALAVLRAMQGRFEEARELVALDRTILDELGLRYLAAAAVEAYGLVELLAGDPESAERAIRDGYLELTRMGDTGALPTVAALLGEALVACERYEEALAVTEEARVATDAFDLAAQVQWRCPQAKALAWRGRDKKALRIAEQAVRLAARTDFLNMHADALAALAEVHRLQGRREQATQAITQAVSLYERKGNLVAASRAKVALRASRQATRAPTAAAVKVG